MEPFNLTELLQRENEQVEWKENVADIDSVLKTISAFANDFQNLGGGYVVCGAKEVKDENGFQSAEREGLTASRLKEIEGKVLAGCREKISPPIVPILHEIPARENDKRILIFVIPSTNHTHSYRTKDIDGGFHYIRIGRETREAKNGLLRELFVKKGTLEPWDRRLNTQAKEVDIDLVALREVLTEIGVWKDTLGAEEYLVKKIHALVPELGSKQGLDNAFHPKNFSLILFGKTPTTYFPGAWTKVSFYPGKDRGDAYSETHDITGNIIKQSKDILRLLEAQQSTAIDKNSDKPNLPKYPERALQEAVINAIVHRNYESDQPVRITVFSDRVEIRSPGGLLRTVDKEKFRSGQASPEWRNQSLAWFFNKLQLAQNEGQGIPTIIQTMKHLGSPTPQFLIEEDAITCILPAHPRHEQIRQSIHLPLPQKTKPKRNEHPFPNKNKSKPSPTTKNPNNTKATSNTPTATRNPVAALPTTRRSAPTHQKAHA
jgi:ATP-dependent DNA helicase RecG